MCLDTVDEKLTVPKKGIGYRRFKMFSPDEPELQACFQGNCKSYPTGVWLKEGDYRDSENKGRRFLPTNYLDNKYPYGFHIYKTKHAAENDPVFATRKVLYRKAVASGTQSGFKVIIAKEMKIF